MKCEFLNRNESYFTAWAKNRFKCSVDIYSSCITLDWSNHDWYIRQKQAAENRIFESEAGDITSIILQDVKDLHSRGITQGIILFALNVNHNLNGRVLIHNRYYKCEKKVYAMACKRLENLGISASFDRDTTPYWEYAIFTLKWPADWNSAPPAYTPDNL
jgi:hypothetical protein